jgi:hypothetical protein
MELKKPMRSRVEMSAERRLYDGSLEKYPDNAVL